VTSVISTLCDFCGTAKGSTNRWWVLVVHEHKGSLEILHPEVLHPDDRPAVGDQSDACGEKCVLVGVQRFMKSGDIS